MDSREIIFWIMILSLLVTISYQIGRFFGTHDVNIPKDEIDKALQICQNNSGLSLISLTEITCQNDAIFKNYIKK